MKTVVWFGFVLGALCAAENEVTITKPGVTVTLNCGVKSAKLLEWRHKSDLILTRGGRFPTKATTDIAVRSSARQASLVITKVKDEDAGKFTCKADGKAYEHTLIVVSVSAGSSGVFKLGGEGTLQCSVAGLSPGPEVMWEKPDGSKHRSSKTVQLNPVASSDAGTWKCSFSHGGKTYHESLEIKVKDPTTTTVPTRPPKGPQTPKNTGDTNLPSDAALLLGLSWWMWVAIGVGGLIVVLLMVLVICLCKKVRRRKRRLRKMKNSRLPLTPKQYCQCDRPTAAAKPQQGRRREKPSALLLE